MTELKEKADKKVNDGWIRTWMMIEVMAASEAAAKSALEKHVDSLEREDKIILYKKDYKEVKEIKGPSPEKPSMYSYVVEIEVVSQNLDKLAYIAMNYGPAAFEILEPNEIKVEAGEAQALLSSIADLVHKYARMGIGGIVVKT